MLLVHLLWVKEKKNLYVCFNKLSFKVKRLKLNLILKENPKLAKIKPLIKSITDFFHKRVWILYF